MDETWEEFVEKENLDVRDFNLFKDEAYIKKVGNQWCVFGHGGKKMGCYSSKPAAEKRLKQIEMFKHMKNKGGENEEFSKQECFCRECHSYFFTKGNKRCDNSRCPRCGEQDSIVEVTGEI